MAERATDVWGAPDEAAYRRLLAALTPDNMLVTLMAKGLPTDKHERIYGTAYSYREDAGPAYAALVRPPKTASFALPAANRFMPVAVPLLAERPLIVHQSGEKHLGALRTAYAAAGVHGELVAFIDDMARRYAEADLVICRAGAVTIAELSAGGMASILVPFPHAVDDHQTADVPATPLGAIR